MLETNTFFNDFAGSQIPPKSEKPNATQVVSKLFGTRCADNKETVTDTWNLRLGRPTSAYTVRQKDLGRRIYDNGSGTSRHILV